MSSHVFIATTQGPVAIQSITKEECGVPSVMCIDGGSRSAGVTNHYYDFVNKGTGLVAKKYGYDAFRLDVEKDIHCGFSWQLPVLIAHHFFSIGALANGSPKAGDMVIVSTGSIKITDEILGVGGIEKKIFSLLCFVKKLRDENIQFKLVFPKKNEEEVAISIKKYDIEGFFSDSCYFYDNALDAIRLCHTQKEIKKTFTKGKAKNLSVKKGSVKYRNTYTYGFVFLLLIGLGFFTSKLYFSGFSVPVYAKNPVVDKPKVKEPVISKPQTKGELSLAVDAKYKTEGGSCDSVQLKHVSVVPNKENNIPPLKDYRNICALAITNITGTSSKIRIIGLNLAAGNAIPIYSMHNYWSIARPKQKDNKSYVLVVFESEIEDKLIKDIIAKAKQEAKQSGVISKVKLKVIFQSFRLNPHYFFHQLIY